MTNSKVEMSVTLRKLRKGENGTDGVGAYMLDLDNENINIGLVNDNGSLYPASGFNSGESGIYVAGGASNSASISKIELLDSSDNVLATATSSSNGSYSSTSLGISSLTLKTSKISVVFNTSKSHSSGERIELRLRGTIGVTDSAGTRNVIAYKTIKFMFQPPGADGVSPVVYELRPSVNSVVISKAGARTPSSVSCKVIKHVGTDYIDMSNLAGDGLTLYSVVGSEEASCDVSSPISVGSIDNLKWVLKKSGVVIDEEVIAFVKDGNDGQATNGTSPILLDLDNENASVPCNYYGTPIVTVNIQSTATLYNGSTKVTNGITWSLDLSYCTATISSGVVSVTAISADSAYVDVKATYQGVTYKARLTITKVRGGANGSSPTIYSIEPSSSAIHKDKLGNMSPSAISCTKYKQVGNGTRQATTEKFLWCVVETPNGATAKEYDGDITVPSNAKDILFILYEDSNKDTVLDKETVFVVSDGSDGDTPVVKDGDNAIVPVATPSSITYTAGTAKEVLMNIVVMDGGVAKTPSQITTKFGSVSALSYGGVTWDSSNKKFIIASTATFNGIVTFSMVYNSVQYTATVQFNKVLNGSAGPAGLIYRKTEWAVGRTYHNDTSLLGSQSLCYLDIVYKTDKNGSLVGMWTCKETHESSDSNAPSATASTTYWELCNIFDDPIYTSLIMAQGSVIAFMQGNELKIFDTLGNLKAGISAASGSYPIFYANPQKYPVDVALAMYASTSTADSQISETSSSWSTSLSVAASAYLHFKFTITYSDGSTDVSYRWGRWQNTTSSAITVNAAYLNFRANNSTTNGNTGTINRVPCTNAANPYLWVQVQINSSNSVGWFYIAEQTAGTDTLHSMYQQFDSGNAIFGMPNGARILLNAAPSDGLPRMDIFDESGNPSAHFDGSWISDSSDLYGSGSSTATLAGTPALTASAVSSSDPQDVSTSRTVNLTCSSDATITFPAGTLKVYGKSGTPPTNSSVPVLGFQQAYADIRIDNQVIASTSHIFSSNNESVGVNSGGSVTFQEKTVAVSKGTHTIKLFVKFTGYYSGYASAILDGSKVVQIAEGKLMARYFANGIAIGSAANNYFMAWNDGSKMQFICENPTAGIKVTDEKAWVKRNGSWSVL